MDWVAVVQQLDRDLLAIEMVRSGPPKPSAELLTSKVGCCKSFRLLTLWHRSVQR